MCGSGFDRREQVLALVRSQRVNAHFQPIVDLHDGLIVAYEALTRVDLESGFQHAGELFEAAAAEGLLWELESLTRRTALAAAANWPDHTRLFINCTPAVFADPRFASQLSDDLAQVPDLQAGRIVLEITELSEDQYVPGLVEQVRAATAAGFNVALDDAGAGASGLNRMMSLRPQWVKLDREFVRGIDSDLLRQNLVRFFVHFARMSGVSVVAEGIESATELQTVTSLGVRFAQGYYLGKPGTRAQTMDAAYVSDVRGRWASVEAAVPSELLEPTLASICRPAPALDSSRSVADARAAIDGRLGVTGIVLLESLHPAAWIAARHIAEADPGAPLGTLRERCHETATLPGGMTVHEALSSLSSRDDERLPDPVLVSSGATIVGTVRARDLLRLAVTDGQLNASGRARLTGLPGRVRADQHLAGLTQPASVGTRSSHDAAFVDIRRFAEFNASQGSARGDSLIRDLGELLAGVAVAGLDDTFVAHLGDDRFLLTAPSGQLESRLRRLAATFDQAEADGAGHSTVESALDRPALRILLIPRVAELARHRRDVYRIEQRMREHARNRDAASSPAGSYVLVFAPEEYSRQAA